MPVSPEHPFANASDEELEAALGNMEAGEPIVTPVEDKEAESRRRAALEQIHYERTQESVQRIAVLEAQQKSESKQTEEKVEELHKQISSLHKRTSTQSVVFHPQDVEELKILGRVTDTKRAGFGNDTRELGGTGSAPKEIKTAFSSETSFTGIEETEKPTKSAPAMFSLEQLQKEEERKNPPSQAA